MSGSPQTSTTMNEERPNLRITKSYQNIQQQISKKPSPISSSVKFAPKSTSQTSHLKEILNDKEKCFSFLQWLEKKHCDENLWFYLLAEAFKREDNPEKREILFTQIWNDFIGEGAPKQINIDVSFIREMKQKKEQNLVDNNFFDTAQDEVFRVSSN